MRYLLEVTLESPLTGIVTSLCLILPALAFYFQGSDLLTGLLAVPSLLAYTASLLLTPVLLLGEPRTELEVSVEVVPAAAPTPYGLQRPVAAPGDTAPPSSDPPVPTTRP
ncbi:hypothetical protein [Methanopyrus kandleri]